MQMQMLTLVQMLMQMLMLMLIALNSAGGDVGIPACAMWMMRCCALSGVRLKRGGAVR